MPSNRTNAGNLLIVGGSGLSRGFDISQLGFPASFNALAADQFPQGTIADIGSTSNGGDSFVQYQPRNAFTTRGSLALSHGSHNIKTGID